METGLCWVLAASPLHSRELLERLRSVFGQVLGGWGFEYQGTATSSSELSRLLAGCRGAVVVVATGGTEHVIVGGLASTRSPVVLAAHPYANSLPALLEAYPLASRLGASSVYVDDLSPAAVAGTLRPAVAGLRAASRMKGSRLGLVGKPSPWLVYSRVSPDVVREKLGVEIVEESIEGLAERFEKAEAPRELLKRVLEGAEEILRPLEEVEKALRLYAALRGLVEERRLDAVTVECFEVIPRLGTTACLAFSLLNSEGIVAGCEADVPSTLAMMLLHWASGRPVFMANPARIRGRSLLLAHCTAPLAAGRYRLLSHFETGKGVGVSVSYQPGETVTLARLSPSLDRLRVGRGVVERSGLLSGLHCRTQVWLRLAWNPEVLLEDSLGNHYVMAPGDHVEALRHAARMLGLRVEVLN